LFWILGGFFVALVLAGIGLGLPEEVIVASAGVWVGTSPEQGAYRWAALPICIIGILISDIMLYGIGRRWGNHVLEHRWIARLMPADKRRKIEENLHRYGVRILLFVRWVPGIRSPMFITAGTMRVPVHRFIVADAIAATLGHSALFFLAWWFGDSVKELVERAENTVGTVIKFGVILAVIIVAVGYFLVHFYRRPVTTADPIDVPLIGGPVAAKLSHIDKPSIQVKADSSNHDSARPRPVDTRTPVEHVPPQAAP
jgi:membrane protein DedA with SNARE-associated domain